MSHQMTGSHNNMRQKWYRVSYSIDIHEATPRAAAEKAAEILSRESKNGHYEICEGATGTHVAFVDLSDHAGEKQSK